MSPARKALVDSAASSAARSLASLEPGLGAAFPLPFFALGDGGLGSVGSGVGVLLSWASAKRGGTRAAASNTTSAIADFGLRIADWIVAGNPQSAIPNPR